MKPTIEEAIQLVREYYFGDFGAFAACEFGGGPLHIFLEDGNHLESDIEFCLDAARKGEYRGEEKAVKVCEILLQMTDAERLEIYKTYRQRFGQ